jgi:hypothetical protein
MAFQLLMDAAILNEAARKSHAPLADVQRALVPAASALLADACLRHRIATADKCREESPGHRHQPMDHLVWGQCLANVLRLASRHDCPRHVLFLAFEGPS